MPANATPASERPSAVSALIMTRLVPPRLADNSLLRERLLNRCSSMNSVIGRLYLVTAPAGYGKSTLLARIFQLSQEQGRSAAWLTLDVNDNDEEQFCLYLQAAFNRLISSDPEFTNRIVRGNADTASSSNLIAGMISHLAASEGQYAIFLDDYHVIENSDIHNALHYLLKYLPENLNVFIGSRQQLPIPLARFKAADRLVQIDTDDLSFDLEEATSLLRETNRLDVSDSELELLHQCTGGWAAILQLTALSFRTTTDRPKLVGALSTECDIAADFLSEEIMAHMPPSRADFLRRIAIVERFCPALCMAITDDREISGSLVELRDSGLLIQSLDNNGQWFCIHPLFRDYLLRQLVDGLEIDQNELHRRASAWFQDENLLDEVIVLESQVRAFHYFS